MVPEAIPEGRLLIWARLDWLLALVSLLLGSTCLVAIKHWLPAMLPIGFLLLVVVLGMAMALRGTGAVNPDLGTAFRVLVRLGLQALSQNRLT